jgi:hypothetical protein
VRAEDVDGQGREGVASVVLERDFTKVMSIGVGGRHGAALRRALWFQSNAFRGFRGKRYFRVKKGFRSRPSQKRLRRRTEYPLWAAHSRTAPDGPLAVPSRRLTRSARTFPRRAFAEFRSSIPGPVWLDGRRQSSDSILSFHKRADSRACRYPCHDVLRGPDRGGPARDTQP